MERFRCRDSSIEIPASSKATITATMAPMLMRNSAIISAAPGPETAADVLAARMITVSVHTPDLIAVFPAACVCAWARFGGNWAPISLPGMSAVTAANSA